MRVTILSRQFPPAMGGIGDHTDRLAAELVARGATVTVVTAPGAEGRDAFDVRVVANWDDPSTLARAVALTTPDVILWQYNPFSIGRRGVPFGAGRLARALAAIAPLAVYLHELWFPWGRNGARGLIWAVAQRVHARAVLRAATKAIVTTEAREETLKRRKVARIPVGTNVEPTSGPARDALGLPADAFVVAHLGTAGPGKDLAPAFDAIRALRADGIDARLLLAGDAGPVDKPTDLNGSVILTGPVPRARDLSPALASADCYLHPDHAGPSAGRRTSIVAALAHGLPVVSYAGPDRARDLIDGTNVILAEPGAPLVAALRGLHDDRARARAIGAAARATYEESYSWRRVGDAVWALLGECAR